MINGGKARIAGELFLDAKDGKLHWFVNCNSGRYCRELSVRPTQENCSAVEALFRELIEPDVRFDDPLRDDPSEQEG